MLVSTPRLYLPSGELAGTEIEEQVEVTLEEVYNGKELKIEVERQALCEACDGVGGSDPNAVRECGACDGRGPPCRTP